ncbi:hypothetical protein NQ317_017884, partial [Molorchus minor]
MACACAKGISEHAIVEIVSVDDSAIRFYLHQIMLKNKNIEYEHLLKQNTMGHGGWKSSSVAEDLEDSLENKKRIACQILPNNCPSSNNSEMEHIHSISSTASRLTLTISSCEVASSQEINIINCSNCIINIHISKSHNHSNSFD